MIKDAFTRRFEELASIFSNMPYEPVPGSSLRRVPFDHWRKWAISAQNLIFAVFGENSPTYKSYSARYKTTTHYEGSVRSLYAVFAGAKDDYDGGYVFNVELTVSGEVFGDFVTLAKQAMSEGHKDVAAVLACAALEDALKRYAVVNDLSVDDKNMSDVIGALKSAGLVAGAQKTMLDSMPRIRNMALHAQWEKLSEPDVNGVIGFVETFILTKFSGN